MSSKIITNLKTILLILTLSILSNQLIAQTTNGIFFQAVARDNFSNPAKDRKIYVQSSIIQTTPTGTKVLTEEHQANTDATGVFNISLGNGLRVGGTSSGLTSIDWSKGPYYLNLKVAITPIGGSSSWDYTKEWVDMGTTSFGAVPFALYSASSAKVDDKLNVSDTTTMLKVYAKAIKVQSLETAVASKLTAADTLTMLAPYAKAAYTIDSSFFKTQLATKISLADSTTYVTPTQLAAKTFDTTSLSNRINAKANTSDVATKLSLADSTKYVTPTQLAAKTFDTTSLSSRINAKANTSDVATKISLADSTKYVTPTQLAAKTFDTTSLSNRINAKANVSDITTLNSNISSNTVSITSTTAAITAETTRANAAELSLSNNILANTASITANTSDLATLNSSVASNTVSITANTAAINSKAPIASPTFTGTVSAPIYATTPQSLTPGAIINWNPANGLNASVTLDQNSTLSFSTTPPAGSYGTLVLTQDATGGRTITLPSTTNKVLGSTSSTTIALSSAANAKDILNFYYDGTNCYWNIGQGYGLDVSSSSTNLSTGVTGNLAIANGGTGATTAAAARTNLGLVIGTNVQAPLVAGTDYLAPNGSAANLTNFPTFNQNTTGNAATATLATTATTATNATTAGNITATSNTTLTSLANLTTVGTITTGTWSGTAIAVANGGTGATNAAAARTNLGLVIGTNVQAPLVAGTDYLAPNGSAANLTNFPTFNQNTTGNAATATLATTATSATNATTAGNITATSNTTLTSLANLSTVGTITSGTISLTTNIKTTSTITAGTVTYPNVHGTANQVLTTTGSGTLTWTTPSSGSSNTHYVGESYGGGVVFYTWDNGAHGLIVSLTDQCCNGSTIGRFSAGTATNTLAYNGSGGASTSNQTSFTTITGGGVGAGKKNTLLILASQGLGNGNKYAARYANEYSILSDGVLYDDWYLGSVDEYHLLANNYPQVLANNSFTPLNGPNKDYWTSTEINLTDAFTVYIRTNSVTSNIFNVFPNAKSMFNNGGYGNVRAIRSF